MSANQTAFDPGQPMERRWHEVWREQCEAAKSIRLNWGIESAFDYVVGEKLLNFAEAAEEHPEFARALPQFVSEVRGMFTPGEIEKRQSRQRRPKRAELDKPSRQLLPRMLGHLQGQAYPCTVSAVLRRREAKFDLTMR